MNVLMVRAEVDPAHVREVETAAAAMFDAIQTAHPTGVRYASLLLPEDNTFVALLVLDNPTDNPLAQIPEFQAFQDRLKGWLVGSPQTQHLQVVGSYRLF